VPVLRSMSPRLCTVGTTRARRCGSIVRMPGARSDTTSTVPSEGTVRSLLRRTLLVMLGDEVVARPLPASGRVSIGRARDCDVRIDHPSISRTHCVLTVSDAGLTLADAGSANGTLLRGARLPVETAAPLAINETIQIGDATLAVQEIRRGGGDRSAGPPAATAGPVVATGPALVLDPVMQRLYELAARVARGSIGVLLVGETGAGKEMLAEHVHRSSPRASGPLIRVNCAALTDSLIESELFGHEKGAFTGALRERAGLIEAADGGTVFLDEIGEVSAQAQSKLLRVLEDRRVLRVGATTPRAVDVRFGAATNRDLEAEVEAGRFRRDLYFRLAGAVLALPPLRERPLEIEALARRFAAEAATRLDQPVPELTAEALAMLRRHRWPGNVRELRNAIERALLLVEGSTIELRHLPFAPAPPAPAPAANLADELAAIERERILAGLATCGGNQTRAAEVLGIPRRTLIKRLIDYGVVRPRKS
jgi:two-component system, NtrC family, response regulator AtoC